MVRRLTHSLMRLFRFIPHLSSLILLFLIGLVLAAPLLQGDTLCTDDGALHIYRTVALDQAIRDGVLYPRWFPDLAFGYGFPFFVYREPLNYYTLEALHLLGLSVPIAFNLTLAGSVILSGLAMFLLARDIFGERGGLMAGIAYLTAPYVLIGPLTRGNLPEVIAFALMPLILFFFRRLIVFRHTRYFVASILTYAALFLTHNISSLLFTPLLIMYVILLGWAQPPTSNLRSIRHNTQRALLAILLTFGLTAFFWLPALAEQDEAQLYLTHSTRGNNYNYNFIDLGELLAGPGQSDPKLLNPPLRIPFGWPQLALAAIGALAYRRASSREQRATIAAAALAVIALTFMALPASKPLWDSLPLIRFVQFPWRFVGRAMLPTALLAGAIFSPQRAQRPQGETNNISALSASFAVKLFLFGAPIFIALIFTAPLSYPRLCPTPHTLDINAVFAYERTTGHIGVDPLGAYLPRSVIERPTGSPLEAQYAAGQTIERFDATALPDGARILGADYGPNRADLSLSTPTAFTATYLAFDFPGWQVRIDDEPVEIRPSDPTGLITFGVPVGEHRILIEFGDSPQRALADGLSLATLLATIASATLLYRRRGQSSLAPRTTHHARRFTLYAFVALVAFVLIKVTLIDPGLTPLRATRLQGDSLAGVPHPLDVTFGDRLRLLGYDVSPARTRPGETIRVDLYWKALRPLDAAYQAEVAVADADGWLWSPKHAERPRDHTDYPATSQWPIDAYAIDSFEVEVLPGTPPGEYVIAAQMFDRATLAPLQPDADALPGHVVAAIGSIQVDRATQTFDAQQLRIYGGEHRDLDADLALLGYNIDRVDTVPGETVLLTFFWQAQRAPQADRRLRVELIDARNAALASKEILIGEERYPTSRWSAGEQVISLATMRVPASAPSGEYHWRGSLLNESGRPVATFDMQPSFRVAAPERQFSTPEMRNRVGVELGDFATLLGFDVTRAQVAPGETIDLTLYWQAQAETDRSYKVFVHVLDATEQIVAQADSIPVDGSRPTTGWLPGEVIADRYSVALPAGLPAGPYHISAGMYDPENNARLKTTGGEEIIPLTAIEVK